MSNFTPFVQIQVNMMNESMSVVSEQFTALIEAIKAGSVQLAENILVASSEDIANQLHPQLKQPPLYFAALNADDQTALQLFKLLIQHGANYRFKDQNEQTVLFYVCRDGKEHCADLLLNLGLNLDDVDVYGQTPMFYAASENQVGLVRKYATKERVNHLDNLAGQTPLYYAARRGHLELCKVLIEKGAEVGLSDTNGKTAMQFARKAKFTQVADLLANELRRTKQVGKLSHQSYSIEESNLQRRKKKEESVKTSRQTYKIVFLNDKGEPHDLTEEEVRQLVYLKPELEAFLCNPETIPPEIVEATSGESWEKIATKILTLCCKLKGAYWFSEPVDPVKFNIMDYFDIIARPMDLSTVRKKLSHNCYKSATEFVQDMNLIWENCYRYNGEAHDISKCAKELQSSFVEYVGTYGLQKFLEGR